MPQLLPLSGEVDRRPGLDGTVETVGPSWLSMALGSLQRLQMTHGIYSVENSPQGPGEWHAPLVLCLGPHPLSMAMPAGVLSGTPPSQPTSAELVCWEGGNGSRERGLAELRDSE